MSSNMKFALALIDIILNHNRMNHLSDSPHVVKHRNKDENLDSDFGKAHTLRKDSKKDKFD